MIISPAIKRKEINKQGKVNIKIRVSHNYGTRFIATEYFILPEYFLKSGKISKECPNYNYLNVQIQAICLKYETKLLQINYKTFSINRVVELLKTETALNDFSVFYTNYIAQKKVINLRTSEIHQATYDKIRKFNKPWPPMFEDLNAGWLNKFESWMISDAISANTAAIHLRNIRSVFNRAIDEEVIPIDLYPFRRFKIKNTPTSKRSLTIEQLRTIRDFQTKYPVMSMARDYFMLSFYLIGINNSDLYLCTKLKGDRFEYSRSKTHREYSIKIEPEAIELIEKLKGSKWLLNASDKYDAVHKFTHQINKALKLIIPGVTMYHARHTWATIAKNQIRAADEDIAAALGHSRKTVTDIYINRDPAIVDKLNRQVLDCLRLVPISVPRDKDLETVDPAFSI